MNRTYPALDTLHRDWAIKNPLTAAWPYEMIFDIIIPSCCRKVNSGVKVTDGGFLFTSDINGLDLGMFGKDGEWPEIAFSEDEENSIYQ